MVRTLLRAQGADIVPAHIGVLSSAVFLAQRGDEAGQCTLALILGRFPAADISLAENLFVARRFSALLCAAVDTHPDYAQLQYRWDKLTEWARAEPKSPEPDMLIEWFCKNHPMQMYSIERDLRSKLRKQGWRL
jgi:hypothetical protein